MAAPLTDAARPPGGVVAAAVGGTNNTLASVAITLTLGLLAFAPLGGQAGQVGIPAAMATVIAGALVYALLGTVAVPAAGASSATALIFAGLVATLARDPALDLTRATDLAALLSASGLCVVLMGLAQGAMAAAGLHRLARLVPQPVLAGFMNGVALLILLAQVPPLLGLPPLAQGLSGPVLAQAQPMAALVGLATAATVWVLAARAPRVPGALAGLLLGTALHAVIAQLAPALPLGSSVGPQPSGLVLPDALAPLLQPATRALLERHAETLLLTAGVLAVIGALETLLAAVAIDQLAGTRHESRRELMASAAANIACGLCGGLPLVLSRTRAVLLLDRGLPGRLAPLCAVACFVLLFAAGGPLLAVLPKPVLAGVMLTIGVAMVDRWTHRLLAQFLAGDRSAALKQSLALVALVGAVTVVLGFPAALVVGTALSVMVFIRSMNRSLLRLRYTAAERPSRRVYSAAQEALLAPQRAHVVVIELEGALFFGSSERLAAEVDALPAQCRALVLDLRRVSTLDESGAVALEQIARRLAQRGARLLLGGVTAAGEHGRRLRAFGCFRAEPRDDWFADADLALESAERWLLAGAGAAAPQQAIALRDSALMHGLDEAQCRRLEQLLVRQHLAPGQTLFREGDPGDRLYVLIQGSISIVGAGGHRYLSFFPGMIFGETAMLDGRGRSAGARADDESVLMSLGRGELDRLGATDPALAVLVMRNLALHLSERLRAASAAWQSSAS